MPVAINMPQRQQQADPLEKLATALNIARSGYGIYADNKALEEAKIKRDEEKNNPINKYKEQVATNEMAKDAALNDPNSKETAMARNIARATISGWEKTKSFKSNEQGAGPLSALKSSIDSLTGAQIEKQLGSESSLFKTVSAANNAEDRSSLAALIAGSRTNNLNERQNQNSVQAGHAWETDPIIKTAKVNLNSLGRSESILNNTAKPLQSNDLNLAYTDYINAVASGGAATEGKIHRELPQTFDQDWEALKQRLGGDGDLRKDEGGRRLINILQQNISKVKEDLIDAASAQNDSLAENYVGNTNPKVQEVVKQKTGSYSREALSKKFGFKKLDAPAGSGPGGILGFEEFMKSKGK